MIIAFRLSDGVLEASPAFAAYQRCLAVYGGNITLFDVPIDLSGDASSTIVALTELVEKLEGQPFKGCVLSEQHRVCAYYRATRCTRFLVTLTMPVESDSGYLHVATNPSVAAELSNVSVNMEYG